MSAHSAQLVRPFPVDGVRDARAWSARTTLERLTGAALLIFLSPVLLLAAVSVALLSRKTPFVAHRRVGQYGEELWMIKLRSMWDRSKSQARKRGWQWIEYLPEARVPPSKCFRDSRVTSRLAAFYRQFSIDELPQLVHVASGRMRLVGPRPITYAEWDEHYGHNASEVLHVPPGITGLWQILGRNRLTYAQRRRLDLFYARHRRAGLDWMILLRTPGRVLTGKDAS
jgi:lipopolysaccharide/colanic/teichoic acid biosynthesis glycosyltransferase